VVASSVQPGDLTGARALSSAFTQVAATLRPAVVRITVEKGTHSRRGDAGRRFQFRSPFADPFGGTPFGSPFHFWFGSPDQGQGQGQEMPFTPRQTGLGSGVIIDPQGYVLTNNHVVDKADHIKVQLSDGRSFTAKPVGTDPKTDLALVKLQGASGLPAARLGDSEQVRVGELVVAIGNPYGLNETVTVGVVSAKGRDHLQGGPVYEDFIQTDATINPGNSGGPLVNLNGEVIGINSAIKLAQFGYTGIGFAIPSNMAKNVADQLRATGRVRRAWLGVNIQDVTPDLAKGLGQGAPTSGALVAQVVPGSPAEKAGLQPGDVVTAVGSHKVKSSKDLQRLVLETGIGQGTQILVWRKGQMQTIGVKTAEMPDDATLARGGSSGAGAPRYGLELRSLTPDLQRELNTRARSGAVVSQVAPGSPAEDAGLQRGDVIVEVDRRPVKSAAEVERLLHADGSHGHLLRVVRGDAAIFLMLKR
jgi:serine protease Do